MILAHLKGDSHTSHDANVNIALQVFLCYMSGKEPVFPFFIVTQWTHMPLNILHKMNDGFKPVYGGACNPLL